MKARIAIIGAGGHGQSVADTILQSDKYELVGFLDDSYPSRTTVWEFPILGKVSNESLLSLKCSVESMFVAIGNNQLREKLFAQIAGLGFRLPTVVHHDATISPRALIGEGCVVLARAVVGPEAKIGRGAIINAGAVVDHHSVVLDFGHLGVNASMAGGTKLGRAAWMHAGSSLGYGAELCDDAVLAAGASL